MRLDTVRESLTGTWRRYTQVIDGIDVIGGGRIDRTRRDGVTETVWEHQSRVPVSRTAEAQIIPPAGGKLVWLDVDGEARRAFRVVVAGQHPVETFANYIDAESGALLRSDPLFFSAKARVFDPNPVAKLNDPTLRDHNDAASAVPDAGYTIVDIPDLPASGPLSGPNVQLVSTNDPLVTPVDISTGLMFDRSQHAFEEVNAYYHIDRVARYMQSLGYTGARRIVAYAIPVDPHASPADNSYYLPGAIAGQGTLYFGDGGTDDAEDSDIMLHEFGHAIQDWIAPDTFTGPTYGEARALGEGFGDYWSFSTNWIATSASGRDQYCIGDWDARCYGDDSSANCGYVDGADCLRRVDSTKTMADFLRSGDEGTEHKNGMIWSSALREIFDHMRGRYGDDAGKRRTDTLVLEGTFGVPPNPTYAAMAKNLLDADRLLYGSADLSTICSAMTERGILAASDCNAAPHGELTLLQAPQHGVAIPDNNATGVTLTTTVTDPRTIDKLYVSLDVAHTARGDLQISLIGPDGTTVTLQKASLDRTADIHVTYGLDAVAADSLDVFHGKAAAGVWTLKVADVHPKDAGSVTSWGLVITFTGDAPLTQRPNAGAATRVIPAVAHAPGANGTNFVTDVRIASNASVAETLMAVFTPSGVDGRVTFAAVQLSLAPHQVLALDDVVARTFTSVGTGQLQISGATGDFVVTSRTYTKASPGTYGQAIPGAPPSSATALVVGGLRVDDDFRSNVGFAESGGNVVDVHVDWRDASGAIIGTSSVTLPPFSHLQIPAPAGAVRADVSGDAALMAYGSVVDNRSGDSVYVSGVVPPADARTLIVPAIHAPGADGTEWRTDIALTNGGAPATAHVMFGDTTRDIDLAANQSVLLADVIPAGRGAVRLDLPAGVIATSRTYTLSGSNGTFGQSADPVSVDGATSMQAIQIRDDAAFRTNVGILESGGAPVLARVHVLDAAGTEIASDDVFVDANAALQFPLHAITGANVAEGRIVIENISGNGHINVYISVIDNSSQDPSFAWLQ